MALTDLQRLRLRIMDRARVLLNETLGSGDGAQTRFRMQMYPVVAGSESVRVVDADGVATAQTRDVDYTIDDSLGLLTFTVAPASGNYVVADYQWTLFSDTELNDILDRKASIVAAAVEALTSLLADTDRFAKYTFGQETVDRTASREALRDLIQQLQSESGGGVVATVEADTVEREELMYPFLDAGVEVVSDGVVYV